MYTEDSKEIYLVDLGEQNNVFYDPRFSKEILEHFKTHTDDLLTIFDLLFGYNSKDFQELNKIPVKNVNFELVEKDEIQKIVYHLNKVSSLGLCECGALDFTDFKNLKSLGYTWHKDTIGIDKLATLERLSISKLNTKGKNLEGLKDLINLKELNIFKSNLTSLSGIEDLKLKKLMLAFLPKLEDLSTFNPTSNLDTLSVISCKNLDVNGLARYFPNVENLILENQGEIVSIERLLNGFAKLKKISVIGNTKIKDIKTNPEYPKYLIGKTYNIVGYGVSND